MYQLMKVMLRRIHRCCAVSRFIDLTSLNCDVGMIAMYIVIRKLKYNLRSTGSGEVNEA